MQVYKFGGASVQNADGVSNITSIVRSTVQPLVVVVSAMGKMTNAFEELTRFYFDGKQEQLWEKFAQIVDFHQGIIADLLGGENESEGFNRLQELLSQRLRQAPSLHYDFEYDQVVSFGELFSTSIISDYWQKEALEHQWVDVKTVLKTDDLYRDANVDWELTQSRMQDTFDEAKGRLWLTQGFLGGTRSNLTTTLGREGSDYTAAIIAHTMGAASVSIWKDVPGVLNADPRWYPDAVKLDELSYNEAIELAFYGAQVIHPKTLKPLQNKGIPLYVKSFIAPDNPGTVIADGREGDAGQPIYILKDKQVFLTASPRDFSFIMEDKLLELIAYFSRFRIKMNLMQNSALNFSACFDSNGATEALLDALKSNFVVRYNEGVQLLTIRQYTPGAIDAMTRGREVIDSQITRKVARFVLR
ncbi:aspartate kinase [Geofilum rhodophaeum]|uniref:aspartate kinase n=1 Tax=Geofilum rhodophaeum TaxID=1965019 RepID=UPI000B5266A8|nr:aspartate kinase [Geofilum rhodophaeum]